MNDLTRWWKQATGRRPAPGRAGTMTPGAIAPGSITPETDPQRYGMTTPEDPNVAEARRNLQQTDYGISTMLSDQEPLLESSLKNSLAANGTMAPNTLTAGLTRLRTGLARTGIQAHTDAATNYGNSVIGIRQHAADQAQEYDLAMKRIQASREEAAALASERERQRKAALYGDIFQGAATVLPWLIPGAEPLAAANSLYRLRNPGSPVT